MTAGENITIENNVISASGSSLPEAPSADGVYQLRVVVINGNIEYQWASIGIAFTTDVKIDIIKEN